ncbi:MAG: hypothetical protein EXR75_16155 [Myxococcales bacterium]|nr:hypothetical protein [Myxococcales bacterium]
MKDCPYCHQPIDGNSLKCPLCHELLRCRFCATAPLQSQPPPSDTTGFGKYLLDRSLVTLDELMAALDIQTSRRKRVGVVARETKRLTTNQVYEILNVQFNVNKRFGQIAIERGFMSAQDLNLLLRAQRGTTVPIGQLLCDLGFVDKGALKAELDNYETFLFAAPDSELPPKSLRPGGVPSNVAQEFPDDW